VSQAEIIDEAKVNLVKQVKFKKSLEWFTRYFFKEQNRRRFIVDEHHKIIFKALERVMKGECKRLIINIAPRYNKTTLAVHYFIAHCLANNPSAKFIHLSYSDSLALDNSETVMGLVRSAEYQELYNVFIKKESSAKNKWYTTEGGGVLARSSRGQVTGFGAGKVDYDEDDDEEFMSDLAIKEGFGGAIIIDDPIKPEEADSTTIREAVNQRFDSTIRNRVDSRNTPIIVIMQRLHPKDLSGYLIDVEPGKWEVVCLPAIKEDGSALCPRIHTIEELEELKSVNDLVFARQYMQNPAPKEGLLFPKDDLQWYKTDSFKPFSEEVDCINSFIDTADEGDDNFSMPFGFNVGPTIYVHDVVFNKLNVEITAPMAAEKINHYKPEYNRTESNMGGGMYNGMLKPLIGEHTTLLSIKARANKHTRIITMSGFIKRHCRFRSDYDPHSEYGKFIENLTEYQKNGKSAHDDAADSLTGLCAFVKRMHSHLYEQGFLDQDDGYVN